MSNEQHRVYVAGRTLDDAQAYLACRPDLDARPITPDTFRFALPHIGAVHFTAEAPLHPYYVETYRVVLVCVRAETGFVLAMAPVPVGVAPAANVIIPEQMKAVGLIPAFAA